MAASSAQLAYCTMSVASLGPATLQSGEAPAKLRFENGISRPPLEPLPESTNFTKTFNGFRSTFNSSADIEGASPKRGRAFSSKPARNILCTDDIDGTKAKVRDSMLLTKRHVNPLAPHYPLPSFVPEEPIIPRQLRNTMDISDIEGSSAKVERHRETRDNLTTADIVGAQACWRPRHKACRLEAAPHPIMDVGFAVRKNEWASSRRTNVLEPHYYVGGREVEDDPRYTKPKPLKRYNPDNHVLQTTDIVGATSKPLDPLSGKRREYKNINFLGDISGAQTGTIKHSIVTMRSTNPLMPVYQALDDGVAMPPPVTSLIPPDVIEVPTINMKKAASVPNFKPMGDSMDMTMGHDVHGNNQPSLDELERAPAHRPPRLPMDKLNVPTPINTQFVDTHHGIYGAAGNSGRLYSSNSPIVSNRSGSGNSGRGIDSGRNLMPLSDRRGSRGGGALAPSASEPSLSHSASQLLPGSSASQQQQQQASARRQAEAKQREIDAVRSLQ